MIADDRELAWIGSAATLIQPGGGLFRFWRVRRERVVFEVRRRELYHVAEAMLVVRPVASLTMPHTP